MVNCYISKLPSDILERIFCKLPITTLLHRCRYVCKSWRGILCNPDFVKLPLQPGSQLILYMDRKMIHWVEFQGRSDQCFHETTEVTFESKLKLVNSCNGLLCVHQYFETSNQEVLHIVNPVTGDYFSLPPYEQKLCLQKPRRRVGSNGCGLGFSNRTKQFKVIRVHAPIIDSEEIHAELFTIGSDNWRSTGKVLNYDCYILDSNWYSFGTFVNGCFHWLNNYDFEICVFDFEEEKFRAFSLPYCQYNYWNRKIGVYENTIYSCGLDTDAVLWSGYYDHKCEFWLMKEYGVKESWTKMLVKINLEKPTHLNDEFRFKNLMMLENGDVLLFFMGGLFVYNPREESFTSVLKTKVQNDYPILHNPRFGSLKDIVTTEGGLRILNVKSGL